MKAKRNRQARHINELDWVWVGYNETSSRLDVKPYQIIEYRSSDYTIKAALMKRAFPYSSCLAPVCPIELGSLRRIGSLPTHNLVSPYRCKLDLSAYQSLSKYTVY